MLFAPQRREAPTLRALEGKIFPKRPDGRVSPDVLITHQIGTILVTARERDHRRVSREEARAGQHVADVAVAERHAFQEDPMHKRQEELGAQRCLHCRRAEGDQVAYSVSAPRSARC